MKLNEAQTAAIMLDARYSDIGNLPSNFIPYGYKSLMIRPFTVTELRLVSKAAVLKEPIHLHRAIDLVIDQDVFDITIGDFYYILMWLRIHSMPKTPYVIEWHCEANVLFNRVTRSRMFYDAPGFALASSDEGAALYDSEPCATHNSEIIHISDVAIISLDESYEALPDPDVPDVALDFPRVRNLEDIQSAMEDPELRMIVGAAQWIAGTSLEERIAVLEAQPNLDLFDMASVVNEQVVHGIRETATLTCRGCGIKRPHTLTLDALSFFR